MAPHYSHTVLKMYRTATPKLRYLLNCEPFVYHYSPNVNILLAKAHYNCRCPHIHLILLQLLSVMIYEMLMSESAAETLHLSNVRASRLVLLGTTEPWT